MTEAVIVDAVRTPGGKRNGKLKDWHPAALAAETLKALDERNGLDPGMVDDVIMGCVMQVGEQRSTSAATPCSPPVGPSRCPAPPSTASAARSQQSMHFAAQGVIAGAYDVVVAAGVEVMTRTPMGASMVEGMGFPFPQVELDRYADRRPAAAGHLGRDDRRKWASPRRPRRLRRPEPHWRSTVVPGTSSGQPAARTALRAMLTPCFPTCMTQPMTTSSTMPGSMPVRVTTTLSVSAARSTGCNLELAVALPERGADGVDDDGGGHGKSVDRMAGEPLP